MAATTVLASQRRKVPIAPRGTSARSFGYADELGWEGLRVASGPRPAPAQHSIFPLAALVYRDYEGVALNDEEKPRLVANLGHSRCRILRDHGLPTVGRVVAEAFVAT